MYRCLLMDSEYCSMGRWISLIVAEETGMKLYEGKDLVALCDEPWMSEEYLRQFDESLDSVGLFEAVHNAEIHRVHEALSKAIRKAVEAGPCIIHERAASEVLKDMECLRVFVGSADFEKRMERLKMDPKYDLKDAEIPELMDALCDEDHRRKVYRNGVSRDRWGEIGSYDLYLDSDGLGRELCARILIEAMRGTPLDENRCREIISKTKLG